jgi:hypothetical protein
MFKTTKREFSIGDIVVLRNIGRMAKFNGLSGVVKSKELVTVSALGASRPKTVFKYDIAFSNGISRKVADGHDGNTLSLGQTQAPVLEQSSAALAA